MLDKPDFAWNDETEELLRVCLLNGLSASQAAYAIGERYRNGPSRNAVIGRARRRGMKLGKGNGAAVTVSRPSIDPSRRLFPWGHPRCDAAFRELVARGLNSDEVAIELAKAFPAAPAPSSAAVRTRASRLGLKIFGGKPARIKEVPAHCSPLPEQSQDGGREVESSPDLPSAATFPEGGVTIADLEHWMCRWPNGDPRDLEAFRYCGGRSLAGRSYCAGHLLESCSLHWLENTKEGRAVRNRLRGIMKAEAA